MSIVSGHRRKFFFRTCYVGLGLLLLFGSITYFFSDELLLKFFQFRFKSICQQRIGAVVSQGEFFRNEKGSLFFKNGKFEKPGEWSLEVPLTECRLALDWKTCSIKAEVHFFSPLLKCWKKGFLQVEKTSSLSIPYFKNSLKIALSDGEIFLFEKKENAPIHKIGCSVELDYQQENWTGKVALFESKENPLVTVDMKESSFENGKAFISFSGKGATFAYALLHYGLSEKIPTSYKHWEFLDGEIDGKIEALINPSHISLIKGDLCAKKISLNNKALSIRGKAEELFLTFQTDEKSPDFVSKWDASFEMKEGEIALLGASTFCEKVGPLILKESKILVKQGQIESSSIHAKWLGMEGELFLNWLSSKELIKLQMLGKSKEVVSFLPPPFHAGFAKAFPEDHLQLDIAVTRGNEGIDLEGALKISEQKETTHSIDFGCHFGQSSKENDGQASAFAKNFPERLKEQFYLSKRRVGWFQARNLPIDKFLSPFLFQEIKMEAQGAVNLEGTFDDRCLIVFYEGENLSLESPSFSLKGTCASQNLSKESAAIHYLDFKTLEHIGILPLNNAVYTQKNVGLEFTNGFSLIRFENKKIFLREMSCNWKDLFFKGEIEVAIPNLEEMDLYLRIHEAAGPIDQARIFFSHITPSFFWKFPLEGNVKCGKEDVFLHFAFNPKAKLVDGHIRGDMCTSLASESFQLKEYCTSFHYDVVKSSIHFTQGEGDVFLNLGQQSNYHLTIPELSFFNIPSPQLAVEMHLLKGEEEIFSCTGHTEGNSQKREFFLEGNSFLIQGIQEENHILIDPFEIGNLKGNADLIINEKGCAIQHLHLRYGDLGSFSLEGKVDLQTAMLIGEVQNLIFDINSLSTLPSLPLPAEKWLSLWKPHGKLCGQGQVRYSIYDGEWSATILSTFHELEFGGMHFGDGENLKCQYSSSQGLLVEGLEGEIPGEESPMKYKLGKLHYHFANQEIEFEEFDFSVPPDRLSWVAHCASLLFPGKIHSNLIESVEALKQKEPLEGRISVSVFPDNVWVCLTLKDGVYNLSGYRCDLSEFFLLYDSTTLFLESACLFNERNYWVALSTDSRTMSQGTFTIREEKENEKKLSMDWKREKNGLLHIRKITGSSCGVTAQLEEQLFSPEKYCFKGKIDIDIGHLSPFLPSQMQKVIEKVGMGEGYCLNGEFAVEREDLASIFFQGDLLGSNFVMGGVKLDSLSAKAIFSHGHLALDHLSIVDKAGQLNIPIADVKKEGEEWKIYIPKVELRNVRLNRLKEETKGKQKKGKSFFKSLLIPKLELESFYGIVGEKESFFGKGEVQFTNLPPKNLVSNLLLIPMEITARIGLDLSLLVPVQGNVRYEIHDGKIHLLKLENMYSDGKRSRFYLAEGSPAYLDFEGNLNLKIKMKQYNLLMKLAEFFTITVKGTLFKPTYTFMNQFDEMDDEE